MEGMEQKLGEMLGSPELMQQIMALAQKLGGESASAAPEAPQAPAAPKADLDAGIDSAAIQKILTLSTQTGIDRNQRALLQALEPYLSNRCVGKLEKAMRAEKLARVALTALHSGAATLPSGR